MWIMHLNVLCCIISILCSNVEYLLQSAFNFCSIKESPHSCLWSCSTKFISDNLQDFPLALNLSVSLCLAQCVLCTPENSFNSFMSQRKVSTKVFLLETLLFHMEKGEFSSALKITIEILFLTVWFQSKLCWIDFCSHTFSSLKYIASGAKDWVDSGSLF